VQAKERREGDEKDPNLDPYQATSGYRAVAPDLKTSVSSE